MTSTSFAGRVQRTLWAQHIHDATRNCIVSKMSAKSIEIQHTIRLIRELDSVITEIEAGIETKMGEMHFCVTTIPVIRGKLPPFVRP